MRWHEILLLTETDIDEVARKELSAFFGMMKVKGIKTLPFDKIISQLSFNSMKIDPNDEDMKSKIIDIISSMDNLVDKVEGDVIYLKYHDQPEYTPSKEKGDKDKKEVSKAAKDTAKKNIKDKKKGEIKL